MTKEITESQYWQIYGLIVAKIKLNQQEELLHKAYQEIVGEDAEGRFWDYYEEADLDKIKKHLGYDKIIITKIIKGNAK